MAHVMRNIMQRCRMFKSRNKQHRRTHQKHQRHGRNICLWQHFGFCRRRHIIVLSRHTRRYLVNLPARPVSWLAGRRTSPAFPVLPPVAYRRVLAAYSRGGGCGFRPRFQSALSTFPFHPQTLGVHTGNLTDAMWRQSAGRVKPNCDIRDRFKGRCRIDRMGRYPRKNSNILWITSGYTPYHGVSD